MTHNVGEFQVLLKAYVFGQESEYSFVLDKAPHDCYEYTGMDLFRKEVHLKLATPVLHRNSTVGSTPLARRQASEWAAYTKSLMRRIGLESEIPDEAFKYGRTGALRGWYLPTFKAKEYEC